VIVTQIIVAIVAHVGQIVIVKTVVVVIINSK